MSRALIRLAALGVLVTAVLAVVVTWTRADGIEADLASQADAALRSAGISGGQVGFHGRDATLRGFPAADAQRAADTVRGVDGVRTAVIGSVASSAPATTPPASTAPLPSPATDRSELQDQIDEVLARQPIDFQPDGDTPTPGGREAVRQVAALITRATTFRSRLEVLGHAAGPGSRRAVQELSRQRARAVARLLATDGVPLERISSRGLGSGRSGTGGDDRGVEIRVR